MKPAVHLCTPYCKIRCFLKNHRRTEPESKCACCNKQDILSAHELARSSRSEHLTTRWWEQEKPQVSVLERSLHNRMERLVAALRG